MKKFQEMIDAKLLAKNSKIAVVLYNKVNKKSKEKIKINGNLYLII